MIRLKGYVTQIRMDFKKQLLVLVLFLLIHPTRHKSTFLREIRFKDITEKATLPNYLSLNQRYRKLPPRRCFSQDNNQPIQSPLFTPCFITFTTDTHTNDNICPPCFSSSSLPSTDHPKHTNCPQDYFSLQMFVEFISSNLMSVSCFS